MTTATVVGLQIMGRKHDGVTTFKDELLKNPGITDVAFKNGGDWGTIAKINAGFQYRVSI